MKRIQRSKMHEGFTATSEGESVSSLTVFPNAVGAKPAKHGFTLIELLLYVGITSIMLGVLGGIGVNVLTSTVKTKALEEVNYNAQTLFQRIATTIENASAITSPTEGASSTTLVLAMSDQSKNPTIYTLHDGALYQSEGGGPPVRISTQTVLIEELQFSGLNAPHSTGALHISMEIASLSSSTQEAADFREDFETIARIQKKP